MINIAKSYINIYFVFLARKYDQQQQPQKQTDSVQLLVEWSLESWKKWFDDRAARMWSLSMQLYGIWSIRVNKKNLPLLHIVLLVDWPCTYMECSLEREKWMHLYLSPVSSFYCKLFPTKSGLCRSSGMFAHHNCFRWCCKRNERPMEPICLSIPYNVRLFDTSSE